MLDSQMTAHQERYRDLRREADTYRAAHAIAFRPWRRLARSLRRADARRPETRPATALG